MEIKRLVKDACKTTRNLWETVFPEDSEKFVDYYYEKKATENIAYVTGRVPYEAMLFRTPYSVKIDDKVKELSYIVGVATRKEFRHKGRMTALLIKAMEEMYSKGEPFTFLMPANPNIYEPFDFSYVYERPQWRFKERSFPLTVLEPLIGTNNIFKLESAFVPYASKLQAAEIQRQKERKEFKLFSLSGQCIGNGEKEEWLCRLADYANGWLKEHYRIYVKRSLEYYHRQLEELKAQNGDIFILEKGDELAGFFLYAREGEEVFVQELMEDEKGSFSFLVEEKEKKPVIMARIIHLEEMMKLVKSPENKAVLIEVEDSLIPQNEGVFLWELTPYGSRVTKQREGSTAEITMTVGELTPHLIKGVFLNEIV